MVFTASLLGAQHKRDSVENKPASLLVVSLGKALKRDASVFMWQTDGGTKQSTLRGGPVSNNRVKQWFPIRKPEPPGESKIRFLWEINKDLHKTTSKKEATASVF